MINELIKYQKWRTGEIDATLDEIGLTPAKITACINWVIESLTNDLAAHDAEVAKAAFIAGVNKTGNGHNYEWGFNGAELEKEADNYAANLRAKAKP